MLLIADLQASFKIWSSNVTASVGVLINAALIIAALVLLSRVIVKSARVERDLRRKSPLLEQQPDPQATKRAVDRLSGLIRFSTVPSDKDALREQNSYIKAHYAKTLSTLGSLELPSGSMLLRWKARERSSENPVLFCAHLDVAPAGDGWTRAPFSGVTANGLIYGRGALDNKCNVIALLEAVGALVEEGYAPRRDIYFAFGHDEESGGEAGAMQIAELLSRRNLVFDMIIDEGGFIVEDFMGRQGYAAALIGVGEKTECTYKVTVRTQPGDSGAPPRHSAVGLLSEAVCRIEASPPRMRLLPVVRQYLEYSFAALSAVKRIAVSNIFLSRPFLPLIFKSDLRTMAMLRSTLSPVQIRGAQDEGVVPTEVSVLINARLLPGESPSDILKYIKGLIADMPAEVELVRSSDGGKTSEPRGPMYELLCRTLEEKFMRLPCIPTLLAGGTDSRHYSHMSDCVLRFSPFIITQENAATTHAPDEYMPEKSLGLGIEVYKNLMRKL